MAKSLFSAAGVDGVDTTDPHAGVGTEFNARPRSDRRPIIPDTALASPGTPARPPVALPDARIGAAAWTRDGIRGSDLPWVAWRWRASDLNQ